MTNSHSELSPVNQTERRSSASPGRREEDWRIATFREQLRIDGENRRRANIKRKATQYGFIGGIFAGAFCNWLAIVFRF